MRIRELPGKATFKKAVRESTSNREVAFRLGWDRDAGASYRLLRKLYAMWPVSTEHFVHDRRRVLGTRRRLLTPEQIATAVKDTRKRIGRYALQRLLSRKAVLHVWRGSQPHNVYVQSLSTGRFLWHSERGERPNMNMFREVNRSTDNVPNHSMLSDRGMSMKTTYEPLECLLRV